MRLPIIFQSLDRIEGKEGKSKLLHKDSELYKLQAIATKLLTRTVR